MSKNILLPTLLCLIGFVRASFAQQTADWQSYSKDGYSIQYPNDWGLEANETLGTDFFLFSTNNEPQDDFRENINLVSQNVAQFGVDLDGYVQLNFGQIRQMATNFKVERMDKEKEGKNGEHYVLVYTMDQGMYHLKLMQYYWIVNGQAYVLTLTCEQDTFDGYEKVGKEIMASFEVK